MDSRVLKGHLSMMGANVLWGLMSPVAKSLMLAGVISPLLLTEFRVAGAAILFWIASAFVPAVHVPAADKLRLAGAALLGIVLNQGCFIFGVGLTSPGEASVITTTMPMWVMLLAAIILKEPITAAKVGGIVIGAAGALILVASGRGASADGGGHALGDILVLSAQLSYALYLTLYRNFIRRYPLITLMKWMFTFAAVVMTAVALPTALSTAWSEVTVPQMLAVGYVVVGATFCSYILVMIGQKTLRPTLVGMYNYVQPVVAASVGVWLGLDTVTPLKLLAVGLIFGGVWLVNISKSRQTQD